jgi:hypothetical protein
MFINHFIAPVCFQVSKTNLIWGESAKTDPDLQRKTILE